MKRTSLLIFMILSMLILSACINISGTKSEKLAQYFIRAIYNYHDTEKIVDYDTYYTARNQFAESLKPFMAKAAYKKLGIDKDPYKIVEVAAKGRVILEIENINLKIRKEYKEEGSVHYEYTGDLILKPLDNARLAYRKIKVSGELKILKENNELKVSYLKVINSGEWLNILNELEDLN